MKKYINPEIKVTEVQTNNMIMATLPVDGSTGVPGESALGKEDNIWDEGVEE